MTPTPTAPNAPNGPPPLDGVECTRAVVAAVGTLNAIVPLATAAGLLIVLAVSDTPSGPHVGLHIHRPAFPLPGSRRKGCNED